MQIGILLAGKVNDGISARFGEYPDMFEKMLGAVGSPLSFQRWLTVEGEIPDSPDLCDAWMVSGSRHGVYDDLPWIEPACEFLRAAHDADVPTIGVCFGHQLLARAFGGRVIKSDRGWGIGVHDYDILARPPWMADAPGRISLQAIHQDQVVDLPPGAEVLASSEFCPYAALAYSDRAFSIQAHPEFTPEFLQSLLEQLRGDRIPAPIADEALASLGRPLDSALCAKWMFDFMARSHRPARAAA